MFPHFAHLPYNPQTPVTVWVIYLSVAVLYCTPMAIAMYRNIEHKWWLYFANLLLGFTGLVWAICLYHAIFAESADQRRQSALA